jgi:hypothetical protein
MLHLLDKVYVDYDFTGNIGRNNLIYVGPMGMLKHTHGPKPLYQFPSLNTIVREFGDIPTFIECLTPLGQKTIILMDEGSMNQLLVTWLRSVFPKITAKMVHRFLKLNAVNHKYEHGSRTSTKGSRKDGFRNLTIPTLDDVEGMWNDLKAVPLSMELKERVSFEYLLAHVLLMDFHPTDRFVKAFVQRMETILWKSVAWDFVGVRRDLLYGMYNLKENFGLGVDLEQDDIDDQIEALEDTVLFNPDNHPGNVEFIKDNHAAIREMVEKVHAMNGTTDPFLNQLLRVLPNGVFTEVKAKELIDEDRRAHCSQIFGRTEFRDNMNNNFIGYLYRASWSELEKMNLNE